MTRHVSATAIKRLDQVPDGPAILLGGLAEQAGLTMNAQSASHDGFRYAVRDGRLLLVGESPRGIYIGAHALLRQLGCGWYVPGKVGEVVPTKSTVTLPDDLDHTETSTAMHRKLYYGGSDNRPSAWNRRINGDYLAGSWFHGYHLMIHDEAFDEHPEWFAMNAKGERPPRDSSARRIPKSSALAPST